MGRNRTIAWIAGLTGHNIAITSITATRRIAVGWIRPSSARTQPEANQPATSARPIHLYIRVTQTSWSNWLSDLKGAAFKQVLLNKPLTRETTLENLPSALCRHPSSASSATRLQTVEGFLAFVTSLNSERRNASHAAE